MQVMVSEPWVLMKPSSQRNDTELPSWRLSPNRFPFTGTPGSGHSLCLNAKREEEEDNKQFVSPTSNTIITEDHKVRN